LNLSGRVAVVTGGASGIGAGVVERFLQAGARVAIIDIDRELGEAESQRMLARNPGAQCDFLEADVSSEAQVAAMALEIGQRFGQVNYLVNNAGMVLVKALEDSTSEDWDRVMNVNVKSVFLMTKYLFPYLRRSSPAAVVNVGSVSSFVGQKLTPIYVASKGAVAMLSKSVALDYAQYGIRVNCVCPGITDTPMLQHHVQTSLDPRQTLRERLDRVPLDRLLSPADIASAILFLCGDESSGITGTTLVVDGGYLAAAEWSNS
jgi:NAD(P)-dependent dehydrogenase (short-subunit alcohol dehydrogenase family)